MTRRYLNPKIDLVFRKLLGSEENKDLLISLINSIVEPDFVVTDLIIKNPYNLAAYLESKESILDIKAVDQNGMWYDIELQVLPHVFYGKRAVYYAAKVYVDQLASGADYSTLNTTIGIHFLDFTYFPEDDRFVRQFVFKDAETNSASTELSYLRLYFIEMGKFRKDWPEVTTALDRWIAFLNKVQELNRKKLPPQLASDSAILKAVGQLEVMGLESQEREIYEGEVKARMVDELTLKYAENKGVQHVIIHMMSRRLGAIPGEIELKLKALSADELDDLSVALFDFNSYADVDAWLTRR